LVSLQDHIINDGWKTLGTKIGELVNARCPVMLAFLKEELTAASL
jgi:hypothetical protein